MREIMRAVFIVFAIGLIVLAMTLLLMFIMKFVVEIFFV